jgi:hypothetical protein
MSATIHSINNKKLTALEPVTAAHYETVLAGLRAQLVAGPTVVDISTISRLR